jgi:hypothetical protein
MDPEDAHASTDGAANRNPRFFMVPCRSVFRRGGSATIAAPHRIPRARSGHARIERTACFSAPAREMSNFEP